MPKSSGGVRVCCDLRELNKAVVRERHVLPKVEDTLQNLRGSKYFAKIDLKSGFFQLDLAEESRYLTTFITHRGCFRFKRTPFGLNDVSEQFQKVMEQILFGLQGVEISVDDVIIHAKSLEKQDACRGVHSACRREVNRHKLDSLYATMLRQGRIPGNFACRSEFPGLKVGRGC